MANRPLMGCLKSSQSYNKCVVNIQMVAGPSANKNPLLVPRAGKNNNYGSVRSEKDALSSFSDVVHHIGGGGVDGG